jgi:uncharacterized protein YpbB
MEKNFIRASGGKVEKISPKAKKLKSKKISGQTTYDVTFDLWKSGNDIAKISSIRGVTQGTVINHFEELFMKGRILKKELSNIIPESLDSKLPEIYSVFKKLGTDKLAPVFEKLEKKYSYDDLKIARLIFEKDS